MFRRDVNEAKTNRELRARIGSAILRAPTPDRDPRGSPPIPSRIAKNRMKRFCLFAFLAFSLSLSASPMLRVVAVKDARTIVVDNRGRATDVTLAQVIVPPHEEEAAATYLRQSLVNSWVMIESDARGGSFVYRSPDAMFVNGALAQR